MCVCVCVMCVCVCVSAVSNPIPSNMRSEAKKAAKILRDFTEISNRNGPDKLIPGKNNINTVKILQ